MSRGRSVAMGLLLKKTPGTMVGSTKWSPLQLLVLSLKTFSVTPPGGALPTVAVATLVTHEQIGRVQSVRTVEGLDGAGHPPHGRLTIVGVLELFQLAGDLLDEVDVRLPLFDDAALLPPLPIDEDPGEAQGKGAALGPIDVLKPVREKCALL